MLLLSTAALSEDAASELPMASQATLSLHQHGKSRVRLGRVWRLGDGGE